MHPSRAIRLPAAAALLVLGATVLLPARYAVLVCRFGGIVHVAPGAACCPGLARRAPPAPAPSIAAAGCCSLKAVHLVQAPVERQAGGPSLERAAGPLDGPVPFPPPRWRVQATPLPSPPAIGPPLIVAKQSFLI
jgi:hypothetical protein